MVIKLSELHVKQLLKMLVPALKYWPSLLTILRHIPFKEVEVARHAMIDINPDSQTDADQHHKKAARTFGGVDLEKVPSITSNNMGHLGTLT